jgi:hypothetical protein
MILAGKGILGRESPRLLSSALPGLKKKIQAVRGTSLVKKILISPTNCTAISDRSHEGYWGVSLGSRLTGILQPVESAL